MKLDSSCLPEDHERAALIGRVWKGGAGGGPCVVALRGGRVVDLTAAAATTAHLLNADDPKALLGAEGEDLGPVEAIIENSAADRRDPVHPWFLAPVDLQAVRACGVTFVKSMLERVIEEAAKGDPSQAAALRRELAQAIGDEIRAVRPGSDEAAAVKASLQEKGLWSQYLEVGLGPDAEVFTKAQPMSSVGLGADVGINPRSTWNNPEPEIAMVVNGAGRIVGATLGNDVNLRDFEGRSALLLGRAKDNNAASAIGPFIRLFDDNYGMDDARRTVISLDIEGEDGFRLEESSDVGEISRDPADLVAQCFDCHQYPDGLVLYTGTMFAPIQDRDRPGEGFTHRTGDIVRIATPRLGALVNRVRPADEIEPWTFGVAALFESLHRRNLL